MASNLYEVLEVRKDATAEQIRKAYKKKALQTHPDKLPQGLSEEEKNSAVDKFREIGHAYEILSDPEKRKEYDIHGVWPPPQQEEDAFGTFFDDTFSGRRRGHRSHTFPSPFARHHHHSYSNFVFRDPFELFNTLFQDMESMFGSPLHTLTPFDPFGGIHAHRSQSLLSSNFFGPFMPGLALDPFGSGTAPERGPRGSISSESFASTTINGVTQTIHTKRDNDGNEHVTRTFPNGREVYTINGVEQPRGHLQNSQEQRELTPLSDSRYIEPNQPRRQHRSSERSYIPSQPMQPQPRYAFNNTTYDVPTSGHHRYTAPTPPRHEYDVPPPSYSESNNMYRDNYHRPYNRPPGAERPISHGRERRATDKYPQTARMDRTRDDDRHHKNWFYQSSRHT